MSDFSKTYVIGFPLDVVYASWVSERTVIPPASELVIEPEPGGVYRLVMPGGMRMNGAFSEVSAERRLRYSWQWEGTDEATEVEVNFAAHSDGTEVSIDHRGFTTADSLETHASGWDRYVEGLADFLAQRR